MNLTTCPVCKLDDNPPYSGLESGNLFDCMRCGKYIISDEALRFPGNLTNSFKEKLPLLSALIREQNDLNRPLLNISSSISTNILLGRIPLTHNQRVQHFLKRVAHKSGGYGKGVKLDPNLDYPMAYCLDRTEFTYLLVAVGPDNERLFDVQNGYWTISPKGWSIIESTPSNPDNPKVFVAMRFSADLEIAFNNGIEPAIKQAGFDAIRIDRVEYNGMIDDKIMAEIRESRFIVADLTTQNQGVYFEAGFASGLGLDVIYCCRTDDSKNIHFDAEHRNQIRWSSPEELKEKLLNRIVGSIGKGPLSTD